MGKVDEDDLDFKLKKPPVLGGRGGGGPSSESEVLPVPFFFASPFRDFCIYLALMNRSIAESASSASMGTGGFLFCEL